MSYIVGSTYRFLLTATKDGAVWDLTGATIDLYLRNPLGTVVTKTGTILVAASGTAYYDSATTDLDTVGEWSRSWRVSQGSVVGESDQTLFEVVDGLS